MKWLCNVLSWHLTCLAVALVILSFLAMPTQGVRANDPSSYGYGQAYCSISGPEEFCPYAGCQINNDSAGYNCDFACGC